MNEKALSHLDENQMPTMVDVAHKQQTYRMARAQVKVIMPVEVMQNVQNQELIVKKGPVIQTAIIAGTMAVKKTWDLIPMCHPLAIESIKFETIWQKNVLVIDCICKLTGKTGVEMEAMTGASIAALTVYDMCKALSHDILITDLRLIEKTGGKSDIKA